MEIYRPPWARTKIGALASYESLKCGSLKAWKFINKEVEKCKSLRVVFKF